MRKITSFLATFLAGFVALTALPAAAYVGPGLGAGTLGVIVGFIGSIFLALFAIIWFPVKRMMKKRKAEQGQQANSDGDNTKNKNAGGEQSKGEEGARR